MTNSNQDVSGTVTDTTHTLSFPEPTGDYAVGTTSYHFVDPEREETYTENPDDNREITAEVWYPSEESGAATKPYMSEDLSNAIASGLEILPEEFTDITQSIPTNSVTNAPVAEAKSEYPVLIFSHGFSGLPELNTIKAEELASQGYIVVALNHTYDSTVNLFPDGRVIPQSPKFGGFFGVGENPDLLAQSVNIRAEDAQFVLDKLEEIDAGDDPTGLFGGKLDLERVGIAGYSLGGATAAKVLAEDSRFKAGINLDGALFGNVADASLSQPFMTFNNEAFGTGNSTNPVDRFNQIQQSFVENLQNEGYEVTISGTTHNDFNDLPFLSSFLVNSGIELGAFGEILVANANNSENFEPTSPELTAQIINDYTTAFFEQHLNDRESPLFTKALLPYPEVIFQPYNLDIPEIDSAEAPIPEKLQQELESALNQTDRDLGGIDVGVGIGVVTPDGIWTGATGVSDLETEEATQPEDLFKIASISKAYTSAVILKLQEQGKLSLEDTLDKWLPNIANRLTNGESLTICQLLDGTGGLWDYLDVNGEFLPDFIADYLSGSNRDWQPEELVTYAFDKPAFSGSDSTEQWTYTNTGNLIAALIAEKATGKHFKQILSEEILEPLGLDNTFFTTEDINLDELAKGYDDILTGDGNIGQDGNLDNYTAVNTEISYGSGSIVSSSEDVAKFFDSLASGNLLSSESTAEIFNYVDTGFSRSRTQLDKFGLGVYPSTLPWGETRGMDGSQFGYKSQVDYFPSDDTTISILANRGVVGGNPKVNLVIEAYKASIANTLGLNNGSVVNGTVSNNYLTGTSNNDAIDGQDGNDILLGKKGLDALDGVKGDDFLFAGMGNDYLFGKEGSDNLSGGKDDDFLNGGAGEDLLQGGKGSDFLIGGDGKDTLFGGKDDDLIDGGADDDLVRDTQGSNFLYGNDGDDLLFAGMGDDVLYGDAGSVRLIANGNDRLFGGIGDDYLNGGKGDDNLIGGLGSDTLTGLSGNDTLTGGDGSDRFILFKEETAIITDFTQGEDFLKLSANISFDDIEIIQGSGDNENNTLIAFESETLAILNNINSANSLFYDA
ncbi:serine hydrolase [Pleurocapsales cyanobacterium LEGE 10410]|nr:serine hydrolase [Pleurocapsales cyanobacterium LEGE 10410]